jgi:long-chain acyl-CoA synthetase
LSPIRVHDERDRLQLRGCDPSKTLKCTVGLPLPSTEAAVMDDEGRVVPPRKIGEICLRGPRVMKPYRNRPDETAKVFPADGWLRTGDVGSMDERGFVKITDRKKDMINVSGFKVFPNEVEDVVAMHPGVLEVAGGHDRLLRRNETRKVRADRRAALEKPDGRVQGRE